MIIMSETEYYSGWRQLCVRAQPCMQGSGDAAYLLCMLCCLYLQWHCSYVATCGGPRSLLRRFRGLLTVVRRAWLELRLSAIQLHLPGAGLQLAGTAEPWKHHMLGRVLWCFRWGSSVQPERKLRFTFRGVRAHTQQLSVHQQAQITICVRVCVRSHMVFQGQQKR
jgi:hypothetical protein